MPNIGFGEIVVILLVALIVFGPRRLPEIGRTVGKSVREFRRATSNLKAEFEQDLEDEDDEPARVKSDWQRRRDAAAANGAPSDPATAAPDDAASMPGPDPKTGGSPD